MRKLMAMFLMKGREGEEGSSEMVSLQCYEVSAQAFRDCRVGMYCTIFRITDIHPVAGLCFYFGSECRGLSMYGYCKS